MSNRELMPDARYVRSYDVYLQLTPTNQSKAYPARIASVTPDRGFRYIPQPPGPNLPDPRLFLGSSPRTLGIEGHGISFPEHVSDEEMQAVAADFKQSLQKKSQRSEPSLVLEVSSGGRCQLQRSLRSLGCWP